MLPKMTPFFRATVGDTDTNNNVQSVGHAAAAAAGCEVALGDSNK